MTNLENQEHAIDFNNRPNAKLYDKSVTKTNKTVQQLNYLMGILHGHPTHVSHLINQTEPRLQFDQSYIYHRKEKKRWWQEPTLLHAKHYSGKRNKNSKINNLTLNQLTTRTLSRDVLLHYHGTNLPEYIPQIWFYTSIQFQERNLSLEKWRGPKQGGKKKNKPYTKSLVTALSLNMYNSNERRKNTVSYICRISLWAVSLRWWRCMNSQYLINL